MSESTGESAVGSRMGAVGAALKKRLLESPTVGVIGLGYVGLPLAVAFGESGATVIGGDLDPRRTTAVAGGASVTEDIASDRVRALVADDRLRVAERENERVEGCAVVLSLLHPMLIS